MAGHSKWANIKHRKARVDQKRGKAFARLIRELTVAAYLGGPAPEDNPRLRTAVDKALAANVSKDAIARAIQRGVGSAPGENPEELTYEGYGPGGVAFIVETMTSSRNRTVAAVRHVFSKHEGSLGVDGSVSYLFEQKGQISLESVTDVDALLEVALEVGAEDMVNHEDDVVEVITAPNDLNTIKDSLTQTGHTLMNAEIAMIPKTTVELDVEMSKKIMRLIEALEDLDDVQNIFTNAIFSEVV